MIPAALNLGILTVLFFVIGMIKPQWALFFMKQPNRFIIAAITTVLVMISVTMYGEGHRRAQLAQEVKLPVPPSSVPVPVPVPEKPVAPTTK
ncbi:MAG: hypothetical protein ACXWTS_04320 [Methylococcaceae bacterium]